VGVRQGGGLGIDIESLRATAPVADAGQFFALDELTQLSMLQGDAQARRFFDFWTLKESYIKARGMGLSLPLDQFAFDLRGHAAIGFVADASLQDAVAPNWQFFQWLMPGDDSVLGALCVEGVPLQATAIKARRVVPFERELELGLPIARQSSVAAFTPIARP
jgi:4'-phosphopantetheinyl transferase